MDNIKITRREMLAWCGACALGMSDLPLRFSNDYSHLVLEKNPVGYWRLGEGRGRTAHDSSPHRQDGTYVGAPTFQEHGAIEGDPNTAIALNGNRSYVEVPDTADFSVPTSGHGLTVEVWMRPDAVLFNGQTEENYVYWLGKGGQGQWEWALRFYSRKSSRPNRISAYIWNPGGGLGAGAYVQEPVQVSAWMHLVACYAPGDKSDPMAGVSLYQNGVLKGSPATQKGALYSSFDIVPAHGSAPLRFGTCDLGSFLKGGLDEIALYPRILTADEIREHYEVGTGHKDL
jgi:hypothetical protein